MIAQFMTVKLFSFPLSISLYLYNSLCSRLKGTLTLLMSKPCIYVCVCCHPSDVAVGCPFGGEERGGRVLIFNGNKDISTQGMTLSQELRAAHAPSDSLPGFGFTLRGGQDVDNNQYPGKYSTNRPVSTQLPVL